MFALRPIFPGSTCVRAALGAVFTFVWVSASCTPSDPECPAKAEVAVAASAMSEAATAPEVPALALTLDPGSPLPEGVRADAPQRLQSAWGPLSLEVFLAAGRPQGFLRISSAGASWVSPRYPMWRAAVADWEGVGEDDVVLGIITSRALHPGATPPHRTLWVLRWDGRALVPLWRGSGLARPLLDFAIVGDAQGRSRLVAWEVVAGERCAVTGYWWNGFGFAGQGWAVVPCAAQFDAERGCVSLGTAPELCPHFGADGFVLRRHAGLGD